MTLSGFVHAYLLKTVRHCVAHIFVWVAYSCKEYCITVTKKKYW